MIGNDIVHIHQAKKVYHNQRWLDKVFSPQEQLWIQNSNNPHYTLWWFWSCKESAYKAFLKLEGKRQFKPKTIQIIDINFQTQTTVIQYKTWKVWTNSDCKHSYFYTIAFTQQITPLNINSKVFHWQNLDLKTGSLQLKQELLNALQLKYKNNNPLNLQKNQLGIPVIVNHPNIDISLTHDLPYFAFAYQDTTSKIATIA